MTLGSSKPLVASAANGFGHRIATANVRNPLAGASPGAMARRRRRRPRWRRIHPTRLAMLERALRGHDPELNPHRAADELARTREGARLLVRVIASPGSPELREAAVYGFYLATTTSPQLALVFRVFRDLREPPSLRGQAAEVLGSHLYEVKPWRRRYRLLMEALIRGLDDPAPVVRYWCIYAVAKPGNTRVLPKLRHIADTDTAIGWGGISLKQEALDAIETIEWPMTWLNPLPEGT